MKKNTEPAYRNRYRAIIEKSLNGERIDAKEFYLKFGNEYLYSFYDNDLEVRLTPYFGVSVFTKR